LEIRLFYNLINFLAKHPTIKYGEHQFNRYTYLAHKLLCLIKQHDW
jgi:hypothetical protein